MVDCFVPLVSSFRNAEISSVVGDSSSLSPNGD